MLISFVAEAPREWGVKSEIEVEREVTVSPALGTGHVLVPDAVILAIMERFRKEVSDYRPTYFKVETTECFQTETQGGHQHSLLQLNLRSGCFCCFF